MRVGLNELSLLLVCLCTQLVISAVVPVSSIAGERSSPDPDSLSQVIVEVRSEGRYSKALEVARSLLSVLHQDREAQTWQVGDAERLAETLEFVCALPEEARQELSEADQLDSDISECRTKGRYSICVELAERQLAIRERHLGEDHLEVASSLNGLAVLLCMMGEYSSARPMYERILKIREQSLGPEHPLVANALNNLGLMLYDTGDFSASRPLHERALTIREKALGPDHPDVAQSLNNLGILLAESGDHAAARPLYERALRIRETHLGPEHPRVATTLNNLGIAYRVTGNHADSRRMYERTLEIWEKVLGPEHPSVASALNNLAILLTEMGDYAGARQFYERALEISENSLSPQHPVVAFTLNNLADLLCETGDYASAGPLYERALAIAKETLGPQSPHVAQTLRSLAIQLCGIQEVDQAEALLSQAAVVFEVSRLRAGTGFSRATFQSSPYPQLAAARLQLGRTEEAWPAAEKALGRALADLLMVSDQRSLSPSEAAREDSLKRSLGQLESQLVALREASRADTAGESVKIFEETRSRLLYAEAAWSTFQREIASKYPVTEGQAFELERVQTALTEETALIGWLHEELASQQYVTWGYVIRDSGPVRWIRIESLPGEATKGTPVDRTGDFRRALAFAASWRGRVMEVGEINSCAADVWTEWVAPLTPYLDGVENLVVIPSGPMLGVPVEALMDSRSVYLGDGYTVSYAPSATIYAWLWEEGKKREAPGVRKALLLGDPPFTADHLTAMEREGETGEFGLISTGPLPEPGALRSALVGNEQALANLPRLPWTRVEVKRIASGVCEGTTLLGPEASEQALIRLAESGALRGFDTIHLATHAFVDDEAPERSGLILSRVSLPDPFDAAIAGTRVFDGLLTAKEIVRELDLDADLVTLSGCQTGLGKEVPGEGYIGLAHAFLQAGAQSLVVSLWRVEDEATALLMERFYQNLIGRSQKEPMPKAEALREAKHWLRTYTDEEGFQPFRHPVYWSGFVLIGHPG